MPLARVRCPNCRRDVTWEGNPWRPFCSERCRLADLGGWATERYRIPDEEEMPAVPDPDDEDEGS
jgi:uncharacterized protein